MSRGEQPSSAAPVAMTAPAVAVVIPCFRVRQHILQLIPEIGPEVNRIFVVDDCCPEHSGDLVEASCADPRVSVLRHEINQGVGGAVLTGYRAALAAGCDIIVKLDGDGQMEPALLPYFIDPIARGDADYTKGNRFYDFDELGRMPAIRIFGNAGLSILNKFSSGYWSIFDPTNGYTAIHAKVAARLPIHKISKRYFFESDMLFRLNTLRAVVMDIPMHAKYEDEQSNLRISKVLPEFFLKHLKNSFKRIFYNYFVRDASIASIELLVGGFLLCFGLGIGLSDWIASVKSQVFASAGTVMLAALPILVGINLLLSFLNYDIRNQPTRAIHRLLPARPLQ